MMKERWLSRTELAQAVHPDAEITAWQIERWHKEDLLPRPKRTRRKVGRGFDSAYPPGTLRQLRALIQLRQDTDDTQALRIMLWLVGFPIPPGKVRESLCAAFARGTDSWLTEPMPEGCEDELEWAERLIAASSLYPRPGTHARTVRKRVGSQEAFVSALTAMLTLALGGEMCFEAAGDEIPEDGPPLNDILNRAIGVTPGPIPPRGDEWELVSAHGLMDLRALYRCLQEATDADLARLRISARLALIVAAMLQSGRSLADVGTFDMGSFRLDRDVPAHVAGYIAVALRMRQQGFDKEVNEAVMRFEAVLDDP